MKILLASAYYPNDLSFGAGQRTSLLHQALKDAGDVTTLILREAKTLGVIRQPKPEVAAEITYQDRGLRGKYGRVPAIASLIHDILDLDEFDVVVGRYLPPLLALPPFRGRSVVDADDAYYAYPKGRTPLLGPIAAGLKTRLRVSAGRRVLSPLDHVWFCCERDREIFRLAASSVLPNVVARPPTHGQPSPSTEPTVLFVGALWYRPNRDSIDWFLKHCWPAIRRALPQARFRAVGAAPPALRDRWSQAEGVECPGFVDDLGTEYQRATVTIAPIRSGGGTQIKVLESLAHGRLPLVSSFVAGGFRPHLRHGESLIVADEPEEMASAAVAFLSRPSEALSLAEQGQAVVTEKFSPSAFFGAVNETITRLGR